MDLQDKYIKLWEYLERTDCSSKYASYVLESVRYWWEEQE